eukprot:gnl/TRDRNA2_/TRDRNA2_94263_c1_seq2.p1 gnl/TRDRNA2_/TRDRNA2_94263_c1~~gnl/TRDRNA2_/TRDRNA2_94263_c1_seq2.p1  ORF type:complete len:215 (+),score=20.40 gnl/TRDRNA2_/TRDRNA2_94263_c1_seq2:55-645(+)
MTSTPEEAPRIVEPKKMGPLNRLFGSVGIDNDGTQFELEHVDPFIMCDYVRFEGGMIKPSFCAHPHAGTAVASVLVEGENMRAWDNVGGFEKELLRPGGIYVVCTGRGCVHDEGTDPVVVEKTMSRAPFGLPGTDAPGRKFRSAAVLCSPACWHRGSKRSCRGRKHACLGQRRRLRERALETWRHLRSLHRSRLCA